MRKCLILMLLILTSSCALLLRETGVLAGNVAIGPLQPAVQVGVPEPTPRPTPHARSWCYPWTVAGKSPAPP